MLSGKKLTEAGANDADYRPFRLETKPLRADLPIYVVALRQKGLTITGDPRSAWRRSNGAARSVPTLPILNLPTNKPWEVAA